LHRLALRAEENRALGACAQFLGDAPRVTEWIPEAERAFVKSVDNFEIETWLMKPYGYQAGKKYPVVLYIHGGPHSAYGEGWFDEFQSLAGGGFYVLFTNPRGSSGTSVTLAPIDRATSCND